MLVSLQFSSSVNLKRLLMCAFRCTRDMTFLLQRNAIKWKEKLFPNDVMRDSVMQLSISVMLKRYFGGNTSI